MIMVLTFHIGVIILLTGIMYCVGNLGLFLYKDGWHPSIPIVIFGFDILLFSLTLKVIESIIDLVKL
jgi:hypothetical protein